MNKRYRELRSYGHPPHIAAMGGTPFWLLMLIGFVIGWFVL